VEPSLLGYEPSKGGWVEKDKVNGFASLVPLRIYPTGVLLKNLVRNLS
jgi:hypothetical protein